MTSFALGLTRCWVSLYTIGLASDARDERRAEIDSDLYEHGALNGGSGVGERWTAIEVLVRLLLGMPADLTWRLDQRTGSEQRRGLMQSITGRTFIGLGLLMTAFTLFIGMFVALGGGENDAFGVGFPRALWGVVAVLVTLVLLAGVWVGDRSPLLGGAVVLAGTAPIAAILAWSVIAPLVWLVMAALVGFRVLSSSGEHNGLGPA